MRYLVAKDKKNRQNFCIFEKKRVLVKSLLVNKFLPKVVKERIQNNLYDNIRKYNRKVKVVNYCILTARPRFIIKKFNISRMVFKELGSFGYLKNIKKSSW